MKKSMKINFDIKIILKYVILISFLSANENVLETIKRKSKEIKKNNSQSSLLQATDAQIVKKAISHENAGLIDEAHLIFKQLFNFFAKNFNFDFCLFRKLLQKITG